MSIKKTTVSEEILPQAPLSEDEASDLLEEAISSPDQYPVNLDWLVPILHYKHISSLTTHLKRHFVKEIDYKKCSAGGGIRAYTYQVTVKCFKKICTKARHASRKQVAMHWIKVIDKKVPHYEGDDKGEDQKKRKFTKKRLSSGNTSFEGQANTSYDEDEDLDVDDCDDEDDLDYSPRQNMNNNATYSSNNINNHSITNYANNNDSDVEIDSSSSSNYLRSLRAQSFAASTTASAITITATALPPPSITQDSQVGNVLAMYSPPVATAPPQSRSKKDFSNVSILSRKRKLDEPHWTLRGHKRNENTMHCCANKEKMSTTRSNLRMLSQLALGLR